MVKKVTQWKKGEKSLQKEKERDMHLPVFVRNCNYLGLWDSVTWQVADGDPGPCGMTCLLRAGHGPDSGAQRLFKGLPALRGWAWGRRGRCRPLAAARSQGVSGSRVHLCAATAA